MIRSRTTRAELLFSVSQVERGLREGRYAQRLSPSAPVYLAAVIQDLTAQILELAARRPTTTGEDHQSAAAGHGGSQQRAAEHPL
ncbi:Histone H2A-Bbd type 2/3 [Plecturocebus cupreus]